MQSLSKSTFLRFLLVGIGMSIFLLIVTIILARNFILNFSTQYYAFGILINIWTPGLLIIPHELYFNSCLTKPVNAASVIILGTLLFPIFPIIMAIMITNTRRPSEYVYADLSRFKTIANK